MRAVLAEKLPALAARVNRTLDATPLAAPFKLPITLPEPKAEDVASAIFSLTEDLDAEFPAVAARMLGWTDVPLMCTREIPVPGSLGKCIRILLHVNTTRSLAEIQHVYIHGAVNLRPTFAVQ